MKHMTIEKLKEFLEEKMVEFSTIVNSFDKKLYGNFDITPEENVKIIVNAELHNFAETILEKLNEIKDDNV